jgi:hypothetical protein
MASKVLAGGEKRRSESRQEEHGSLKSFRRSRKTKQIFGESLHDLGCTGSAVLSGSYTLIVTVSSFRVAEKWSQVDDDLRFQDDRSGIWASVD